MAAPPPTTIEPLTMQDQITAPPLMVDSRDAKEDEDLSESDGLLPREGGGSGVETYNNDYGTSSTTDAAEDGKHYRGIDRRNFWWLFAGIIAGDLIAFFDYTFMASSHPVITSYFHASNSASWLSTVFFLTSTVSQPLYGRISDTVGRRSVYLFAICVFLITTIWCAIAQSIGSIIAARAFCGLGAGGVMAMGFIILSDVVKIEYRGLYQTYINIAFGFGNGAGAALGGLMCDRLGWRAAFGVQVPFIFAYLVLAFFSTPKGLGLHLAKAENLSLLQALKNFDTMGSVCLTMSVSCLILGINLGGNIFPWSHPVVITSLVIFFLSSVALVQVERRAERPILPLSLLSTIPIANLMWSNFFLILVTSSVLFNAPLFFQAVRQVTPTTSGLYLISPLVLITITSTFTGAFITWTRRLKPTLVIGAVVTFAGAVATVFLSAGMPSWVMLGLIPWTSAGQGFNAPSTIIAVLALSSQEDQAVVTTTLGLCRYLGSIFGVAVSSWIVQNALVVYLKQTVTGVEKDQIILRVRRSIQEIAKLDPKYKAQVISAYAQAMRVTFLAGAVLALVIVILIVPIRVPRLQRSGEQGARRGRN